VHPQNKSVSAAHPTLVLSKEAIIVGSFKLLTAQRGDTSQCHHSTAMILRISFVFDGSFELSVCELSLGSVVLRAMWSFKWREKGRFRSQTHNFNCISFWAKSTHSLLVCSAPTLGVRRFENHGVRHFENHGVRAG
jgi:hypothetical protein